MHSMVLFVIHTMAYNYIHCGFFTSGSGFVLELNVFQIPEQGSGNVLSSFFFQVSGPDYAVKGDFSLPDGCVMFHEDVNNILKVHVQNTKETP